MANIPGNYQKIQREETDFRAAISASILRRIGATINKALTDGVVIAVGSIKTAFLSEAQFQNQMGDTWVLMDGRDVTGSDYAVLTGNTAIPDARGCFLRMKDNGAGIDGTGDPALGSYEQDNVPYHNHSYSTSLGQVVRSDGIFVGKGTDSPEGLPPGAATVIANLTINNAGALDTRARNLTCNFFIKINASSSV